MIKKFLKTCAAVLSSAILLTSVSAGAVSANALEAGEYEIPSKFYSATISTPCELVKAVKLLIKDEKEKKSILDQVNKYTDKVDNSKDPYFPAIGDQGSINSCGAWSAVYYQLTHEMNRALNRQTTPQNTFQPLFVYNLVIGGNNWGTYANDLYEIMCHTGCATVASVSDSNNIKTWNPQEDIWKEANNYRIDSFMQFRNVGDKFTRITSPRDSDLDALKIMLRSGHIISFAANVYSFRNKTLTALAGDPSVNSGAVGNTVIYKVIGTEGSHAMVIVGYDDNIWTDINDNGKVDSGELGAFKIANSWGDVWDHGFAWVAYDAINSQSVVPGVAEEKDRVVGIGNFMKLNIDNSVNPSKIYLKYTLNSSNRTDSYIKITATRKTDGAKFVRKTSPYFRMDQSNGLDLSYNGTQTAADGTMIVDLDNVVANLDSNTYNDYDWSFTFVDEGEDSSPLTVKNAVIVDENMNRTYTLNASFPFSVNKNSVVVKANKCYNFKRFSTTEKDNIIAGNNLGIVFFAENETRNSSSVQYLLKVYNSSGKLVHQAKRSASKFDTSKKTAQGTFIWKPKEAGDYKLTVFATDASGSVAQRSQNIKVNSKTLKISELVFDKGDSIASYERVEVKPIVCGGTAPYKYSYYYSKDGKTYTLAENTTETSKAKVFGTAAGTYKFTVKVTDAKGKTVSRSRNLLVKRTKLQKLTYSNDFCKVGDYLWIYTDVYNYSPVLEKADYIFTVEKDGVVENLETRYHSLGLWYPKKEGEYKVTCTIKYKGKTISKMTDVYTAQKAVTKVNVNVISYIYDEGPRNNFTIHYWNKSGFVGDAKCNYLGKTKMYNVGYWGTAQKFYQYEVEIPDGATGFKFHIGDKWFGVADGDLSKSNTVYIFNYSGDKALYTKE